MSSMWSLYMSRFLDNAIKNKSSRLTLKTQGLKKQTAPLLFSSFFYFIFIFL